MTVLLIWNNGEEFGGIEYYIIPSAPDWVLETHRRYMNVNENDVTKRVNDALASAEIIEDGGLYNPADPIVGTWRKYKIDDTRTLPPIDGELRIVEAGFLI